MTSIVTSAKTGSARKLFEDPREAHWASSERGRAAAGKSLTKAFKEFSVVARVNGSEHKLCFHFLNRGNSRDVFAAVVDGTTSLVMKLVVPSWRKGIDVEVGLAERGALQQVVNPIIWYGPLLIDSMDLYASVSLKASADCLECVTRSWETPCDVVAMMILCFRYLMAVLALGWQPKDCLPRNLGLFPDGKIRCIDFENFVEGTGFKPVRELIGKRHLEWAERLIAEGRSLGTATFGIAGKFDHWLKMTLTSFGERERQDCIHEYEARVKLEFAMQGLDPRTPAEATAQLQMPLNPGSSTDAPIAETRHNIAPVQRLHLTGRR
jgi:hypothetical protein